MKRAVEARLSRLEREQGFHQEPTMIIVKGVDPVTGGVEDSAIVGYKRRDDTVIWRMEGESAEELRCRIAKELLGPELFFEVEAT